MNRNIAHIQELLAAGWDVDDIVSDDRSIAVLFRRGRSLQTVTLDQQDAWAVLYGDALQGRPTPPRHQVEVTR